MLLGSRYQGCTIIKVLLNFNLFSPDLSRNSVMLQSIKTICSNLFQEALKTIPQFCYPCVTSS